MRKLLQLAVVAVSLTAADAGAERELPQGVTLVSLLADSASYHDARIIVTGYVCQADTETWGLFLTRTDCEDANYWNAVELNLENVTKRMPPGINLLTIEGSYYNRQDRVFSGAAFIVGEIRASNVSGRTLP